MTLCSSRRLSLVAFSVFVLCWISAVSGFLPSPSFRRLHSEISRPRTFLPVSTAPTPPTVTEESSKEPEDDEFGMPWTKVQDWVLRDNLPRYVVSIPVISSKQQGSAQQQKLHALWRTMTREVTELSGYPIEMLQEMYARQLKRQKNDTLPATPDVLPLLDEFEFESSGGLSGRVYGVPGVADGTKIETTEVRNVQFTVPKGYVQTEDGAVAYELGVPLRDVYSLDGGRVQDSVVKAATGLAKGAAANVPQTEEDPDTMLVRLGFATATVLAGATAINMLSHHLTVNVFWV